MNHPELLYYSLKTKDRAGNEHNRSASIEASYVRAFGVYSRTTLGLLK